MYQIGQLFKNSPIDTKPMFKLIKIVQLSSGLKYYKVKHLYNDLRLILHETDYCIKLKRKMTIGIGYRRVK